MAFNRKIINISSLSNSNNSINPFESMNKNTANIISNITRTNTNCKFLKIYNDWHLGDNVFNIHYLNKISNYLEKNNIHILYFLKSEYIIQVSQFIKSNNIHLIKSPFYTQKNSIHLWVGNKELLFNIHTCNLSTTSYNDFLKIFYNSIFNKIFNDTLFTIQDIAYTDNDLLDRYENLPDKYKNVDILIVNSMPMSGQLTYIDSDWHNIIDSFSQKYKTVITKRINKITNTNSICTLDDNLSIKDIGALSTKVKIIIAVNTGVVTALLNTYTLNNILHYCNLDKTLFYNYPKFTNYNSLKNIKINLLMDMLDNSRQ